MPYKTQEEPVPVSVNGTATTSVTARRDGLALALLCVAQFTVALDVQIVAIALPAIGQDLDMSQANLQWVVSAYVLTFGGFLLFAGRLADLFGRRRLFMLGFGLFTLASLGCGLARSEVFLNTARAVQGLGAAFIAPAALSLLTNIFSEGPRRNRALGVWGAAAPLGGAAGFLLGGILTDGVGWPWVFLVNVPVGVLTLALTPFVLAESHDRDAERRLDLGGAVTGTTGLVLLVYGLTQAEPVGFGSLRILGVLGAASAFLCVFYKIESRVKNPLVPFAIFRKRNVTGANLIYLVLTAVNAPILFLLTLYLQGPLGYRPLEAGLAFLPASLVLAVAAPFGAWLTGRIGYRLSMAAGTFTLGVAAFLFARVSVGGSYFTDLLPGLLLLGVGLSVGSVAATVAGTARLEANEQGLASGLLNTSAQVGTALGLAALVALSASRTDALLGASTPSAGGLVGGLRLAFLCAAGLAGLGAVAVLFIVERWPSRADN